MHEKVQYYCNNLLTSHPGNTGKAAHRAGIVKNITIDNKPNPVRNVSNGQKTEHSLSIGTKLAVAAHGMTIARHTIMHIANIKYVNIAHVNVIIAIASLIFSFSISISFGFMFFVYNGI